MTGRFTVQIDGEEAMVAWGRLLGEALASSATLFFHGTLGSGKTTLCRGVLRTWGHLGAVKSPTYTLVEPYCYRGVDIYHFDLYRLGDPEELEYMGIRDYFDSDNICLVEWPERGRGILPDADLDVMLSSQGQGRLVELVASGSRGEHIIDKIRAAEDIVKTREQTN